MMRDGASAAGVVGVAPSDTAPSEISLVTGVSPGQEGPTLWEAAAQEGLKTAAVYWPSSGHSGVAFDFPASSDTAKTRDIPFESVARGSRPAGIVDSIESAHPGFEKELWDDTSSAGAAAWLLANRKADLVFVSFNDVDALQRETTAIGLYAREALENDDDLIGQMLAAAPAGTVVALVSAHGFENENYLVRPRILLGKPGAETSVEVRDGLIGTEDSAVAARLRQLMKDGRRHGLAREVPLAEVRAKAPLLGNWVAAFDTPPGYVASGDNHGPALGPGTHHGVSGLWPTRPGYRSVLVIAGPGIRARKLGEIDLLQIAPTLAEAIGVKLNGRKPSLWALISR